MKTLQLYYAANRKHGGPDRWAPAGYGTKFSDDGAENLRFGRVELDVGETLLKNSRGNYVLQSALERMYEFTPGSSFPRMFEHVFLCAPDVDDTVLDPGHPLGSVHELSQHVTVYSNTGDIAMYASDYTKGNPERLGHRGPARPALVHSKVHSVDCSPIVAGLVEHSYCMDGSVNQDIRFSISSNPQDASLRKRTRDRDLPNVWKMK